MNSSFFTIFFCRCSSLRATKLQVGQEGNNIGNGESYYKKNLRFDLKKFKRSCFSSFSFHRPKFPLSQHATFSSYSSTRHSLMLFSLLCCLYPPLLPIPPLNQRQASPTLSRGSQYGREPRAEEVFLLLIGISHY